MGARVRKTTGELVGRYLAATVGAHAVRTVSMWTSQRGHLPRHRAVLAASRGILADLSNDATDIARVRGLHTWDAVVL